MHRHPAGGAIARPDAIAVAWIAVAAIEIARIAVMLILSNRLL